MQWFFSTLAMFAIPAVLISGPIWFFTRKRVSWLLLEYFTFLLPFFVWFILASSNSRNKSLSNAGIEPLLIGILVGVSQIMRIFIPELFGSRTISATLTVVIQISIAIFVYFFMPTLPE